MQRTKLKKIKGFSLLEMATVLIIIGLLLTGILKGQELIQNAKTKALIQDLNKIHESVIAYKQRTGDFPGDSGTTDGIIDSDPLFWQELNNEGYIPLASGSTSGPNHDFNGKWTVVTGSSNGFTNNTNQLCASGVSESIVEEIDRKLDDGDANEGVIRTGGATSSGDYNTGSETEITFCIRL